MPNTVQEVQLKLNTVKAIRQTLEQGQNKLRYVLELKEKVIMNTEQSGAVKIQEDTENLKQDFEKLLVDVQEIRNNLVARAAQFDELYKVSTHTYNIYHTKIFKKSNYHNNIIILSF